MLYQYIPAPPTEYESKSLGTWTSSFDVNNFFNAHTPYNGWSGLKLGNYVTIQDGTYNKEWEIAGFNLEHNRYAEDGNIYDNGYGICMIPKTKISTGVEPWTYNGRTTGGYKDSTMHTSYLVEVANNLKGILGDHLINRNVLLSSANDDTSPRTKTSSAYTWTFAYCTLMSVGQVTGTFGQNNNKYDDGEANYKLPLFDHEDYKTSNDFWTRGVYGLNSNYEYSGWCVSSNGSISSARVNYNLDVRPLIYLR